MNLISQLKNLFFENLGKIFVLFISTVFFLLFLFPFDDLSDLITTQIAKATNNTIFLQFKNLDLKLFPLPGAKMESVNLETPSIPSVYADQITITPSISGLIQKKALGHFSAQGLLKGDVDIVLKKGSPTEKGTERQLIEISSKQISLPELRSLANLPVLLKGQMNLETTILADLTFQEQPDVELDLSIQKFELPPANVKSPMGDIALPELKLSSVEMKGRLAAGRFIIENGTIGKPGDDLSGRIKGNVDLSIVNQGNSFGHQIGAYDLEINLKTKKAFEDRAALFLSFVSSYRTPSVEGFEYKFKVSASSPMMMPSISAAR